MEFLGYPREDGSFGVRNYLVVMSTVSCANGVVEAICQAVPEAVPITHTEGCGRGPADLAITNRTLLGLGKNPNVGAVLLIGLGCEFIRADFLCGMIAQSQKPAEYLLIQEQGGVRKCTEKGIELAGKLWGKIRDLKREPASWKELTLGLECGGSDAMSGVSANPVLGVASDWIVEQGGRVILSETTEMIGTEKILARRAKDEKTAEQILKLIESQKQKAKQFLGAFAGISITPGNIEGGLSSIQEKSLGCIIKAGTSQINQVVQYGEIPTEKGLVIMDTPGSDIFSMTGMVAGGAQLIAFTTGRGSPAGFPIAPVIKISSTSQLAEKMPDIIDFDAGKVLEGKNIEELGKELIQLIQEVANGKKTRAELNRQNILAIHTTTPAF